MPTIVICQQQPRRRLFRFCRTHLRTRGNPVLQNLQIPSRDFFVRGRHLTTADSLEQQTGSRVTGNNRRAGLPPLQQLLDEACIQTTLQFRVFTVTVPAPGLQDAPCIGFENRIFSYPDSRTEQHDCHPQPAGQHLRIP